MSSQRTALKRKRSDSDISTQRDRYTDHLTIAIRTSNATEVQRLLDAKANPNAAIRHDDPPILLALRKKNIAIIEALIRAKVDVNQTGPGSSQTALWLAIEESLYSTAELLLEEKANTNIHNPEKSHPLAMAIIKDAPFTLITKLIQNKADLTTYTRELDFASDSRPIHRESSLIENAVRVGKPAIVYALLRAKAIIPETMKLSEPSDAIRRGRERALEVVQWAKSPEERPRIKSNLLRDYVKKSEDLPILEWLLEKKADAKTTCLHRNNLIPVVLIANYFKNEAAVQKLIAAKANTRATVVKVETTETPKIPKALSHTTDDQPPALFKALRDAPETVAGLIKTKANVNVVYEGWTPLLAAISFKASRETFITLLEAKANSNCTHPKRGINARSYAKEKQHFALEEALAAITSSTPSAALLAQQAFVTNPPPAQSTAQPAAANHNSRPRTR